MRVNSSDPTQQGMNRADANRKTDKSANGLQSWIYDWIDSIPTEFGSDYLYQIPPLDTTRNRFESAALGFLMVDGSPILSSNIEGAMRSGVFATQRDSSKQLEGLGIGFNFDSTFSSQSYQRELLDNQIQTMGSLESNMRDSALAALLVIMSMMKSGFSPDDIKEEVKTKLAPLKSKLRRVNETSINKALNDGKFTAITLAASALGLAGFVQHRSALLSTTRSHHKARHLKVYSVSAQNRWWSQGANRINCRCSVRPLFK